jgi:hypothetical protein
MTQLQFPFSTNMTKVTTRTMSMWNYMDNEQNMESNSQWISMEVRVQSESEPHQWESELHQKSVVKSFGS